VIAAGAEAAAEDGEAEVAAKVERVEATAKIKNATPKIRRLARGQLPVLGRRDRSPGLVDKIRYKFAKRH